MLKKTTNKSKQAKKEWKSLDSLGACEIAYGCSAFAPLHCCLGQIYERRSLGALESV